MLLVYSLTELSKSLQPSLNILLTFCSMVGILLGMGKEAGSKTLEIFLNEQWDGKGESKRGAENLFPPIVLSFFFQT